jgi:hypothetical protein
MARNRPEALAAALAGLAPVAAMALDRRLLAVPLALLAGATVERYRQGRRERPLTLTATPRECRRALAALGWRYAIAATATGAAALALLVLPALRHRQPEPAAAHRSAAGGGASSFPKVKLARYALRTKIRVDGAVFSVFLPAGQPWARTIRSRSPGERAQWVVLGVDARNLGRRRFNPNVLAYRLADARGNRYAPVVGGGTGPDSLRKTGSLRAGESAQARLGFRVPSTARRLALLFEPVADGSLQVEVPVPPERRR